MVRLSNASLLKAGVEDGRNHISNGRSSICWRGRRESDNGRQKPEIMVMTSTGVESYLLITPITPQTCHAKPKTQINRRRTLPALPVMDAYRKQLGLKDFSEKSDAVALQQIKERGALPMIDRGDIRNRPLQQYLGSTAGRWLWSVRA